VTPFPARWGLAARIVTVSLALLMLVQLASFGLVRASIGSYAREQIGKELEVAERVFQRRIEQNAERLRQGSTLLASDYGFRAAVSSADTQTIESALENQGARIGANVTALFDISLKLQAMGENHNMKVLDPVLRKVVQRLSSNPQSSQIAVIDQTPYQFVLVPMKAPLVIGWVMMGFPIGQELLDDVRALLPIHLVLLARQADAPPSVAAATLPSQAAQQLLAPTGNAPRLELEGDTLLGRRLEVASAQGEVSVLLLRSVSEVTAPFNALQLLLGVVTAFGLALFGLSSALAARRVTTPLRDLVQATKRMGEGNYEKTVVHVGGEDEIGRLATSFDQMRVNIAGQREEIQRLAYWDRLTGLPNRVRFRLAVQQAIANTEGAAQPVTVVLLNLDRFKPVNDTLGYALGDQLLCAVAGRLSHEVARPQDLVARVGGDEFAVLLLGMDQADAFACAQRIVKVFERPLSLAGHLIDLSASVGVACWPAHAADADELLSRSEIAMHQAKRKLQSPLVYVPSDDASSVESLSQLTELRRAIEQHELRLLLQPKLRLHDSSVTSAECLVRWQHPRRGMVPPMMFIPFAEQTGFIRELTLWMVEEAARLWAGLQGPEQPLRLSVNLSTRDLLDQEFPARVASILGRHGVSAQAFCLEITESAIMDDPKRAETTLHSLAQQGFKLSIDDFGTGYSSLAYLSTLPVNELKIDKSFVMAMQDKPDDVKIVKSTIDLAHNLGLAVVAEGVENQATLDQLTHMACDEAQGYFVSKPMTGEAFVAWREQWLLRQPAWHDSRPMTQPVRRRSDRDVNVQ
jgi:diguanylate cyclase (GGDEF)-like protein